MTHAEDGLVLCILLRSSLWLRCYHTVCIVKCCTSGADEKVFDHISCHLTGWWRRTTIADYDLTHFSSSLCQWADQQAAVADRPSVRVSEGPGGGEEEPPGAAVLALPAQQRGGRAGAVDRSEGGGCQLARTGSRLWACHSKYVSRWCLWKNKKSYWNHSGLMWLCFMSFNY